MEGPGIPLVKTENHYTRYVSTDNLIGRSTSMESNTKADEEKTHLGFRLRIRKELIGRRTRVVDASFLLSLIGIIANVFDTELKFSGSIGANSSVSVVLRIITSITTVLLVMSVILYNLIGIKLQLITAGLENWSLVINYSIIFKTVTEVIVCSFHPLPYGDVRIPVMVVHKDDEGNPEYLSQYIPANSILSVLMFCRLYILGRFLVVHSDLFRDTTVQSLGTLSKVRINAQFVFKALMTTRPGTCLTAILLSTLIISSWSIRVCEFYTEPADGNGNYLQALWLTSVTFLTLGYGDVVPHSICGRIIAIKTGLMGVGIMALCVAVLARKLEQTRSERYVHTFVQQIHMDKLHRHAAADVVKQSMIVWKLRRSGYSFHSSRILRHRRKLLDAIRRMNQSQFSKSQLRDCVIGTVEVAKGVAEINDVAYEIKEDQANIQQRLENLEKLMTNIHFQLYEMRESMREKEKSVNLKKN